MTHRRGRLRARSRRQLGLEPRLVLVSPGVKRLARLVRGPGPRLRRQLPISPVGAPSHGRQQPQTRPQIVHVHLRHRRVRQVDRDDRAACLAFDALAGQAHQDGPSIVQHQFRRGWIDHPHLTDPNTLRRLLHPCLVALTAEALRDDGHPPSRQVDVAQSRQMVRGGQTGCNDDARGSRRAGHVAEMRRRSNAQRLTRQDRPQLAAAAGTYGTRGLRDDVRVKDVPGSTCRRVAGPLERHGSRVRRDLAI